ncbi:MAG: redoxin domain-containing protein [Candidatus Omnitrophica bacterium]|nr:redoxin domain-containing protein [Candidatus Omnitrophota bacterium]
MSPLASVIFILSFVFFAPVAWAAAPVGETVNNFSLLDHHGKFHTLDYYRDQKAVVIVVGGNGCPIVRKSIPYLNDLKKQFEGQSISFLMLNSNPQDDHDAIVEEARDFGVEWPILDDRAQVAAAALNVARTAEAFIIDPRQMTVVYRGPVSDKLDYEAERPTMGHEYLKDHLNAFLNGKTLADIVPSVKGCLVSLQKPQMYTYTKDIAPILSRRCFSCHSEGGVAPWQMRSYEKVKGWGPMIREVVSTKRMPPWFIDPHHGEFKDELNLLDDEVRALVFWVDQGMPRGKGKDPLLTQPIPQRQEWTLGKPDIVFQFDKEQVIPPTGVLPIVPTYITPPVEQDMWIKSVHMLPGNFRVVHHANVIAIDPAALNETTNMMEVSGPEQDWHKESGNAVPAGQIIAGYVPGYDVFELPEDAGMFVPKGRRLGFFMHYVTTGREERDLTKLGLYLYKTPPRYILSVIDIHNTDLTILPGEKEHLHHAEYTLDQEMRLTGLSTHMHYRGKYMNVTAQYPTGEKEVLISVPYYRFSWQKQYMLKNPKVLPAGTKILVDGAFDNSELNPGNPDPKQTVKYGPQSADEMFNCFLFYTREK